MSFDLDHFLHQMANKSHDALLVTTADVDETGPIVVYCNAAFERMTGFTAEELLGSTPRALLHVDESDRGERDKIRAIMKRWAAGERDLYERVTLKNKKKNGDICYVEMGLIPFWSADNSTSYWCSVQRDVTEQVMQKKQIEALSSRVRAIHRAAPDGIVVIDDEQRIRDFNEAAEDMFGWCADEIIGQHISVIFPDQHSASASSDVGAALFSSSYKKNSRIQKEHILETRHRDGHVVHVSMSISSCRMQEGRATIAVIRDISELQHRNQELLELSETLAERTSEAEQASQAKSEFLAMASHELRTPLNAIIGFSDFLCSMSDQENFSKRVVGYLQDIHGSGQHLLALVNDMLEAKDVDIASQDLELNIVELSEVVMSVRNMLGPMARAKGLKIVTDVSQGLCVFSDQRLIKQVLINFTTNAIKFSETGDVVITARAINGQIELSVRDNGVGIAAEDQAKVFDKFARLKPQAYTADVDGMGLGLNIAKSLADALGGEIFLNSVIGRGSTFTLLLPEKKAIAAE